LKIKNHIKELLIANQGVIIPDLGGFVSEYEPACFDVSESKFLPPSNKIQFKPEYSYQDDLLIDFISEKENLSKEESKKLLADFVKDLKSLFQKGEKIDFPEIGTLSQDTKGTIHFIQAKETNLLTNSFGLKSINSKPIVNHPKETKTKALSKQKKSHKKLIILISSVIFLLCLLSISWHFTEEFTRFNFASSNDVNSNSTNTSDISQTTVRNLDSIAKADSVKALINESIDENTDKKDALFYSQPEEKEENTTYSQFYIIAGSFKKIENAEKYAIGIREKGFKTEIIESGENLIRISIFKYSNESEALKKLYELRQKSELKSVWILKEI
jgi:cell division protein FtsN